MPLLIDRQCSETLLGLSFYAP